VSHQADDERVDQQKNTGGGAYVEGSVDTGGGHFIGRDGITIGDVEDAAVAAGERATVATKGGIAISGDVGGDLVVSIGNTQVAIPRLTQITLLVILLSITFLVGLQALTAYQASRPTPVAPMTGDFNIAVAQFQVYGEGEEGFKDAQELARGFANAIEREINDLADEINDTIQIRFPQETGIVHGNTDAERAENARALAAEINADVVIYGTIVVDDLAAVTKPEFYVSDRDFTLAAEVAGQYRMGGEIPLDKVDNRSLRNNAEDTLENRFRALTYIINGLSDFTVGQYEEAGIKFSRALEIQAWDTPDVIYVLLGNVALHQHKWMEAEEHFSNARDINPDYARAHGGLATAFLFQAAASAPSGTYDFDIELLDKAIDAFQRALDSSDQSPLADTPTRARFGLGEVYLRKALRDNQVGHSKVGDQNYDLARQAYGAVIQDYEAGNKRVQEFAARAHAQLGLIYWLNGQPEAAILEYEQAIDLLPDYGQAKELKAVYQETLDKLR
jgi:tetratricopeptide (TPR) repeat protein